jgi:hypothetical protein
MAHSFYLSEFEQNVRNAASLHSQHIQQETKRREIYFSFLKSIGNETDCKTGSRY